MKKNYLIPEIHLNKIGLEYCINVNSINGEGVGYGGGADPATGRSKNRNDYLYDEFEEEQIIDVANKNGLW